MNCFIRCLVYCVLMYTSSFHATEFLQITDLGTSARMIGFGNIEGFDPSAAVVFENPAGLHRIDHVSLSGFYTTLFDGEIDYVSMAGGWHSPIGPIAFGLIYTGDNDIYLTQKIDDAVSVKSTFRYSNTIAKLGWQHSLSNEWHVGLALSGFLHQLVDDELTGFGVNMDAGLLYQAEDWSLSIAGKNIIPFLDVVYSNDRHEDLPTQLSIAGAKTIDEFTMLGQLKLQSADHGILKSASLIYRPRFLYDMIYFSGAWKERNVQDDISNTFVVGVGLELLGSGFNVAFEKSEYFLDDNNYYFSSFFNF